VTDEATERWTCPHRVKAGEDRCIFHLSIDKKSAIETIDAFYTVVNEGSNRLNPTDSRRHKQFIGAVFPSLELPYAVLDAEDNYPIDLRHCHVNGPINFHHGIIRHPVSLDGCVVTGQLNCSHLQVEGDYIVLSDGRFESGVKFDDATLDNNLLAIQAQITGNLSCHNARIGGHLELAGSTVAASNSEPGNLVLAKSDIGADAGLSRLILDGQLLMGDGRFGGSVWLKWSKFKDNIHFRSVLFERDVRFEESAVEGVLSFFKSTFEGEIRITITELEADTRAVDLRECRLNSGTLSQPSNPVIFDFRRAVVSDLEIDNPEGMDPFDYLYILQTRFDGFDFGNYTQELTRRDWKLHDLPPNTPAPEWNDGELITQSPENIENTYLKAKNGATEIGDNKAAARFFRREMIQRRAVHLARVRRTARDGRWKIAVKATGSAIGNFVLGAVTKHGEGSWRVVAISIGIISAFVGIFAGLWGPNAPPYGHPAGYLVLSLESFVTLVLGGSVPVRDPWWLRLVANVEGFAGVFLVAVLVFTLTRSVHR